MQTVTGLPITWREDAAKLRSYGDERGADVVERLAAQLEAALRQADQESLTPTEAAEVSGYSKRRLRELVEAGELENVGRKGAPRYRRGDLPTKPGRSRGNGAYSAQDDAKAILGRIGGR